jgi:hypothetical protein
MRAATKRQAAVRAANVSLTSDRSTRNFVAEDAVRPLLEHLDSPAGVDVLPDPGIHHRDMRLLQWYIGHRSIEVGLQCSLVLFTLRRVEVVRIVGAMRRVHQREVSHQRVVGYEQCVGRHVCVEPSI